MTKDNNAAVAGDVVEGDGLVLWLFLTTTVPELLQFLDYTINNSSLNLFLADKKYSLYKKNKSRIKCNTFYILV